MPARLHRRHGWPQLCWLAGLALPLLVHAVPVQRGGTRPVPVAPATPLQQQLEDLAREHEVAPLQWNEEFEKSLGLAARQNKPLLLYFTSPFCGWCKRLEAETLQTAEVRKHLADFVLVRFDTLRDEKLAARFRVRGTPTLVFLSPEGRESQRFSGYVEPAGFLQILAEVLGHKFEKKSGKVEGLIKLLEANKLPAASWPDLVFALSDSQQRETITRILGELKPTPRKDLVELLKHPLLAVRVGALELLEELAGDDFGFSPWLDESARNVEALKRWQDWTAQPTNASAPQLYKALSEDEVATYLRDLLGADYDRASRARRMLQRGGASSLEGVDAFLRAHPELPTGAVNKLREVRYGLWLPAVAGVDPGSLAHRLVFGNLDLRLRTLREIATARRRALPVIHDFLSDPEPLVRETAVDAMVAAGGRKVVPALEDQLKREQDSNVIYLILKQLGSLPSKHGLAILTGYIGHTNEDFAVIALESIGKLKSSTVADEVGKSLSDARWRVRVAGLKAAQTLRLKSLAPQITKLLADPDEFVRGTAVEAVGVVAAKEAVPQLEALFQKDDALKGPIIKALTAADVPVSETVIKALASKAPSVLLGLLDRQESADAKLAPLLEMMARHPDSDVACAALRLVAWEGMELAPLQRLAAEQMQGGERRRVLTIMQSLQLSDRLAYRYNPEARKAAFEPSDNRAKTSQQQEMDDLFKAFEKKTPPPTTTPAVRGKSAVEDLFNAFSGGRGTSENFFETFLKTGRQALQRRDDPELRLAAGIFLAQLGEPAGLLVLEANLAQVTADQRAQLARQLGRVRRQEALPLVRRLLSDPVEEVRTSAVGGLLDEGANEQCVNLIFQELLRTNAILKCYEAFQGLRNLTGKSTLKPALNRYARLLLDTSKDDLLVTFALILLNDAWDGETGPLVERFLRSANPWQRRAAWYALGKNDRKQFEARFEPVTRDPSEYVRMVLPALYSAGTGGRQWVQHFNEEKTSATYEYVSFSGFSFGESPQRRPPSLPDAVRSAVRQLATDPAKRVRFEANYCLLTHHETIDLNHLVSVLEDLPRDSEMIQRISSFVMTEYRTLGTNFGVLLPYLTAKNIYPRVEAETLYAHFGTSVDAEETLPALLAGRFRPQMEASYLNVPLPAPVGAPVAANLKLVFFIKPGCPLCDMARKRIDGIREAFPELSVLDYDITKTASVLMNEALSERFGVPANVRLVAPAVFTGAGYLIKEDITMDRLGSLLARAGTVPVGNWLKLPETELAAAQANIVQRYQQTGLGLILAAGLLDGINPCAFATIIFLLSYLQVTRKRPRDIAQIGLTYILGVFLAYLVIGMGLLQVAVMVARLRWIGQWLNWTMGAFALVIMALSLRDGVYCLRGRVSDMTLQLPDFLKRRIHGVIRAGVRQAHFVLVAFFMGVAISVLELACTGQVYLPTIAYMVQSGETGALWRLTIYNLAFITPLTLIFILAYSGMKSETLLGVLKKHAAVVKFSTSALFLLLFLFLVFGNHLLIQ